jgi:hypothetical protein
MIINNICGCEVNIELLEKAMHWYSNNSLNQTHNIFMHAGYPTISIYGKHLPVHRLLMMYVKNKKVFTNNVVHHIDENVLNARLSNLQIMNHGEHARYHNKGKAKTQQTKEKLSLALRGKPTGYKINLDDAQIRRKYEDGYSLRKLAAEYKVDRSTIKRRLFPLPTPPQEGAEE